jgi:hypothetical protein
VFDNSNVKYDIILGTNFLSKTGIKLNYSEGNMEWYDCSIPLCPPRDLNLKEFDAMEDMFHIQVKDKLFSKDWSKCFATQILGTMYEKTAVPSHHYVGRMGYHIYGWSARHVEHT